MINQTTKTNMYIRSIKDETTEEQFKKVFEKYGEIVNFCLKKWAPKNAF